MSFFRFLITLATFTLHICLQLRDHFNDYNNIIGGSTGNGKNNNNDHNHNDNNNNNVRKTILLAHAQAVHRYIRLLDNCTYLFERGF